MSVALVAALIAAAAAQADPPSQRTWQRFATRPSGFGDTDFLYNRLSRRRTGDIVSVWVTYDFHYSGRNDTTDLALWEVDCRRLRSRTRLSFTVDGDRIYGPSRRGGKFVAIAPGSGEAALAGRVCAK